MQYLLMLRGMGRFMVFSVFAFIISGPLPNASQWLLAAENPSEKAEASSSVECKPKSFNTHYEQFQVENIEQKQVQIWYSFGQEEYKHRQYQRAIPYYWKVLVNDTVGTYKVLYYKLANCYYEVARQMPEQKAAYLDSALLTLYRGLDKYPKRPRLHYLAGRIQRGFKHFACAIPHYEALIKIIPENKPEAKGYWKVLADLLYKQNDERAITVQQKYLSLDPQSAEANQRLIEILNHFGKDPLEQMRKAFNAAPEDAAAARRYGRESLSRGHYKAALKAFLAALQGNPNDAKILGYVARSYEGLENYGKALQTYKEILKITPRSVDILCAAAHAYAMQDKFSDALRYVKKAKKMNAASGLPYITIAEIYENAVNRCAARRKNVDATYDDKLVYEKAVAAYQNARRDPKYKALAAQRIRLLKPLSRTREEIHLYSRRVTTKDPCYQWIK